MDKDILNKSCVIYMITNKINLMHYIGKTQQKLKIRMWAHKNHNEYYLGRAVKKYGWENFKIEILEECTNVDELNEREIFWIKHFNTKIPNGYNLTDGGEGTSGRICSEESRKLRSKNNPRKRAVRCLDTGEIFESAVEAAGHFNILPSTICSVCKGKVIRSGGMKFEYLDQPLSEENRLKERKRPSAIKICCVTTKEIFNSIAEAAKNFGIPDTNINAVCHGKCRHAKGYVFEFLDEKLRSAAEIRRQKLAVNKKAVKCIEKEIIYESIAKAAKAFNVSVTSIKNACNIEKTVSGCHFEFVK